MKLALCKRRAKLRNGSALAQIWLFFAHTTTHIWHMAWSWQITACLSLGRSEVFDLSSQWHKNTRDSICAHCAVMNRKRVVPFRCRLVCNETTEVFWHRYSNIFTKQYFTYGSTPSAEAKSPVPTQHQCTQSCMKWQYTNERDSCPEFHAPWCTSEKWEFGWGIL